MKPIYDVNAADYAEAYFRWIVDKETQLRLGNEADIEMILSCAKDWIAHYGKYHTNTAGTLENTF